MIVRMTQVARFRLHLNCPNRHRHCQSWNWMKTLPPLLSVPAIENKHQIFDGKLTIDTELQEIR